MPSQSLSTSFPLTNFKQACFATRAIFFVFGLGISSWAPMIPFAKMRLNLNDAELGLILLIFGIGALSTLPLSGWLIHRFGSRVMTLVSGLSVAIILPFLAIASSAESLGFALFLFGVVTSALNISINAQAVDVEIRGQKALMSGFHCLFSTGGLLGAILVSILLEINFSLLTSILLISCIIVIVLFFQWQKLLKGESPVKRVENKRGDLLNPKILFLGVICFISFMAEGSMLDWSAEFLKSELHYEVAKAGIGYAIFSIAMAFGRLFGDKLIHRFGGIVVFQLGSLMAALGFLTVNYMKWGHAQLAGFALIGFGCSNIVPILFSTSGKMETASFALTMVTSIGYVGMLLGPALIGFIAEATTLSTAFASIAFLLMGISLCGRLLRTITSPAIITEV